jgi:MoaA/NifB/PqqE/SkfB family radical SAM enzyme
MWKPEEVIRFASDCVAHGVRAVSLGGGEPFEYDGIFDVIDALYPKCYLSVTSNGLPLEEYEVWKRLLEHSPDKIHLTIHQPDNKEEVQRVIQMVLKLGKTKIKPGVNLLVGQDKIVQAKEVYRQLMKYLSMNDNLEYIQK